MEKSAEVDNAGVSFPLPQCKYNLYKNSIISRCLFKYVFSFRWLCILSNVLCVDAFRVMLAFAKHK